MIWKNNHKNMSSGIGQRMGWLLQSKGSLLFRLNAGLMTGHLGYFFLTSKQETIVIKNKFIFTENGFSKFMVLDAHDRHLCMNNSVWNWQWNCVENWNSVEKGDLVQVKTYGIRIPVLGIFPNIVGIQNYYSV